LRQQKPRPVKVGIGINPQLFNPIRHVKLVAQGKSVAKSCKKLQISWQLRSRKGKKGGEKRFEDGGDKGNFALNTHVTTINGVAV
jgi:hypothetical protein